MVLAIALGFTCYTINAYTQGLCCFRVELQEKQAAVHRLVVMSVSGRTRPAQWRSS